MISNVPLLMRLAHCLPTRLAALSMLSLGLSFGCGSDGSNGTSGGGATGGSSGSVFGVGANVPLPDGTFGTMTLLESLEGNQGELSLDNSLLAPGGALFFFPEESNGEFFAARNEDLTVTKYRITQDLGFEEIGVVSFANTGISGISARNLFISAEKAYFFNRFQRLMIVWNPSTMEVVKTVALTQTNKEGFLANYAYTLGGNEVPVVNGKALLSMGWVNFENGVALRSTGLLVIDTETDEVEAFHEDERCPLAINVVSTANGDAYFGTYEHFLADVATRANDERPACILRVRAGETNFDPDFQLSYAEAFGGRVGINLTNAGQDTKVIVRVLDESIVPYTSPDWNEITDTPNWEFWTLDLETQEVEQLDGFELSPSGTFGFLVDGEAYIGIASSDFGSTTVVPVERPTETAFTSLGFVTSLNRAF